MSRAARTWRPVALGRRGAAASNHPLATRAGLDVLADGGNAADAAVAMAGVLAVVEPALCGVGGDAFFLVWDAPQGEAHVVHAVAPAAGGATLERYGDHIPAHGPLAAITPCAASGWQVLAERWGTRSLRDGLAPGAAWARDGFPAARALVRDVAANAATLAKDPGCASVFLPGGAVPSLGTTIRNPALARTLEAVGGAGAAIVLGGELGGDLARFVAEGGGVIALEDLAASRATVHPPLRSRYRDLEILEADRPSMGFALNLVLAIVEHLDVASAGHCTADGVHLLVEAKKLAYALRERFAGDPAHVAADLEALLSPERGRALAQRVDVASARAPAPATERDGDTTYFCVVDGEGSAVSGIQSLAGPFGACAMDPVTGVLLNNRMTWFHLDPKHPNVLGPGKLVRNTINPPLALRDGALALVWGTPGGDAQVQVSLQTLTSVVDHGLDPQQAVEAPRWVHFQPSTGSYFPHVDPDLLLAESRFGPDVLDELRRRGHRVSEVGPLDGSCAACMIQRDETGLLLGGADPRRDGLALAL